VVGIISFAAVRGECHLRLSKFTARLNDNQYSSFRRIVALTHEGVGMTIAAQSRNSHKTLSTAIWTDGVARYP
jgi:hypothetical protein